MRFWATRLCACCVPPDSAVDVQNYIDNTGVQVADVVVGLMHLENLSQEQIATLFRELAARNERLDYYCWDLYARVSAMVRRRG